MPKKRRIACPANSNSSMSPSTVSENSASHRWIPRLEPLL